MEEQLPFECSQGKFADKGNKTFKKQQQPKNVDAEPKKTENQFPLSIIFYIAFHNSSIVALPISTVRSKMTNYLFKTCTRWIKNQLT